jgi:hypothetical protein
VVLAGLQQMRARKRAFDRTRRAGIAFGLIAGLAFAQSAGATAISLSDVSSEPGIPASVLDATLDFSTINGNPRLILTVTNDTTAPDEFNINELYFNASTDVTSLNLTKVVSSIDGNITNQNLWTLFASNGENGDTHADGFGVFDWALIDGVDSMPGTIEPGEILTFTLGITGTGPFDPTDFIDEFSMNPPGNTASNQAAKFVTGTGPSDPSAFGARIPEPSTGLLLAMGLFVLGSQRRGRGLPERRRQAQSR